MGSKEKGDRYYNGFLSVWYMDVLWVLVLGSFISILPMGIFVWIFGGYATDSPSALRSWMEFVAIVLSVLLSRWLLNGRFQRDRRAKVREPERRARVEERRLEEKRKSDAVKKERDAEARSRAAAAAAREKLAKLNFEHVPARIPETADDFETVCAEWMERAGFSDVARTPKGPDGGIDVIASNAVGQAKFHPSQKVTGESVRALVGSKVERKKKRALFFHYGPGYTPDAIEAARSTGVELYQLDVSKARFKRIDK